MAIANSPTPSSTTLELLIKPNESTAGDLVKLSAGQELQISDVMGKGFNMEAAPPDEVDTILIFATGTGISPISAMLEADKQCGGILDGQYAKVILFYGARSTSSMAFQDKFKKWEESGATIIPVFSKEKDDKYVQDKFKEMLDSNELKIDGSKTAIVLCGQKEMAMAIRAIAEDLQVPETRIITNF